MPDVLKKPNRLFIMSPSQKFNLKVTRLGKYLWCLGKIEPNQWLLDHLQVCKRYPNYWNYQYENIWSDKGYAQLRRSFIWLRKLDAQFKPLANYLNAKITNERHFLGVGSRIPHRDGDKKFRTLTRWMLLCSLNASGTQFLLGNHYYKGKPYHIYLVANKVVHKGPRCIRRHRLLLRYDLFIPYSTAVKIV